MTAESLKLHLMAQGSRGIALDIDETLSATNVAWFQKLVALFGNPEEALTMVCCSWLWSHLYILHPSLLRTLASVSVCWER